MKLDEELAQFAGRRLDEACPYLIVDARYERVREAGVIRSQAVLLAIDIGWDGRRSILAVELTARAARAGATSCWACASADSQASSSWSRTTMPGSGRRSSRSCPKPLGSAVEPVLGPACGRTRGCISCATPSTTCRARSTTIACGSSAGWKPVLRAACGRPGGSS